MAGITIKKRIKKRVQLTSRLIQQRRRSLSYLVRRNRLLPAWIRSVRVLATIIKPLRPFSWLPAKSKKNTDTVFARPAISKLVGYKKSTDSLVVELIENPEDRVWWRKAIKPISFLHFLGHEERKKSKYYTRRPWKQLGLRLFLLSRMRTLVLEQALNFVIKSKGIDGKTIQHTPKEFQRWILNIYRRVMHKALGDYIKIFKHRFFMKYFRVFFEHTTGYKELELRYLWWNTFAGRGIKVNSSAAKGVRDFRLALLLRLDTFITSIGIAPTPISAKDFIQSGVFLVNGVRMFNHFYTLFPKDVVQVMVGFFKHSHARFTHGWLGVWSNLLRDKLQKLAFLDVEWAHAMFSVVRWPRDWEEPRVDDGLLLSEQWLRFYIRFLMPTKIRKWRAAKYWWETYKNNQRMWDRGHRVKFPGASKLMPKYDDAKPGKRNKKGS